jgi:dolichol kinase
MKSDFTLNGYKERLKCDYLDRRSSLLGEVQRQLIHLLTGIILIFLIRTAGSRALTPLLLLLAFYILTSVAIFMNKLPPLLSTFLCRWGRPSKQSVPLKGTILLLCGITFSFILFPEDIIYASIAIVAFGDSVATAVGVLIGNHKLPYSEQKTVEGTISGIVVAFLASSFFVTPVQALVGSVGGMLLESVVDSQTSRGFNSQTIIKLFLNDNFLIPLFSGLLMFVLGLV